MLNKLHEWEDYVFQNEDVAIQEKRAIRMALRALDGLVVTWPYTHTQVRFPHIFLNIEADLDAADWYTLLLVLGSPLHRTNNGRLFFMRILN